METKKLFNKKRPLSWSAISSFEYDPEQWYRKYVLGIQDKPTPEMLFGNEIGGLLATDLEFLPSVPRYKIFEKKLEATLDDISIVGFLDSFCPETFAFHEYKTSSNPNRWDFKAVQNHGQLMFYKLLIWINYNTLPEDIGCSLTYIPVVKAGSFKNGFYMKLGEAPTQTFDAKHTVVQVLEFGNFIKETFLKMENYALNHT